MDSKSLYAYVRVYETKNIHKAAEQLFISQQGLSRTLQNLEREYGCRFFERTVSGLIPTEAGERFYDTALRITKELDGLSVDLQDIADGRKTISVACAFGTMHLLYEQIQKFYRKYPNIIIRWTEYQDLDADQMLLDGETGLLLYVEGENQERFEQMKLFSDPFGILVYRGHRFWGRTELNPEELKEEWLLLESRRFHVYHRFFELCGRYQFTPKVIAETTDITLSCSLCGRKEGLAVVPKFIAQSLHREDLQWIPLNEKSFSFSGGAARLAGRQLTEPEELFWKFLKNVGSQQ